MVSSLCILRVCNLENECSVEGEHPSYSISHNTFHEKVTHQDPSFLIIVTRKFHHKSLGKKIPTRSGITEKKNKKKIHYGHKHVAIDKDSTTMSSIEGVCDYKSCNYTH